MAFDFPQISLIACYFYKKQVVITMMIIISAKYIENQIEINIVLEVLIILHLWKFMIVKIIDQLVVKLGWKQQKAIKKDDKISIIPQ